MMKELVFLFILVVLAEVEFSKGAHFWRNHRGRYRAKKPVHKTPTDCPRWYKDHRSCKSWRSHCHWNSRYYQYMKKNCKITCGICRRPRTHELKPHQVKNGQNFHKASSGINAQRMSHSSTNAHMITFNIAKCLAAHNSKRSLHGVPHFQWDYRLASESGHWALYLARKSHATLEHSVPHGAYGENIYYKAYYPVGRVASCSDAVQAWYDEIKLYNFDAPSFSRKTGHFTQVVWKASTKVGVGMAVVNRNGWTYTFVVARYAVGNVYGAFEENVPRLRYSKYSASTERDKNYLPSTLSPDLQAYAQLKYVQSSSALAVKAWFTLAT